MNLVLFSPDISSESPDLSEFEVPPEIEVRFYNLELTLIAEKRALDSPLCRILKDYRQKKDSAANASNT